MAQLAVARTQWQELEQGLAQNPPHPTPSTQTGLLEAYTIVLNC